MRKSKHLILSVIGVLSILSFVINISHGSNLTEIDTNPAIKKINDVEYNYFINPTPADYDVIFRYGKLPTLQTENQRQNWSNSLKKIHESLDTEFSLNYTYPNGKVITYGENSMGYLVVVFYKNFTIEKTLINEIYALINKEARKINIHEIPVEFGRGGFPVANVDGRSEAEKKADEEYEKSGRGPHKPAPIATYGKLPELKTEEQRWNWTYKTQRAIIEGLSDKLAPYFIPKGPLLGFGTEPEGYFMAIINQNLTVEKPLLDEIYGLVDEEAKKRGIQEVPVEFTLGSLPQLDLISSSQNGETTTTPQINKTAQRNENSAEKSTPGFGLLGGMISVFCVWLFRRK